MSRALRVCGAVLNIGCGRRGTCEANGESLVKGPLVFTRDSEPSEVPGVKSYLLYSVPKVEDPSIAALCELCTTRVTDMRIADAWTGETDLQIGHSGDEIMQAFDPRTMGKGFYFSMGMAIDGVEVLCKYV
jgi:hypothetical protein